jgi:hypothetical protein
MSSQWEGLKSFLADSNNQSFLLGLLALFVLFYILRGETGTEKFQRFFKVVLCSALLAFLYALYYFFIKN